MGRTKRPVFAVVAADTRSPRDGRFIEDLGRYEPLHEPARVSLREDRILYWLQQGAQPSETVRSLLSREGLMLALHLQRKGKEADEIWSAVEAHRAQRAEKEKGHVKMTVQERRKQALEAERAAAAEREAEEARLRAEADALAKAAAEEARRKAAEERARLAEEAKAQQDAANAAQAAAEAAATPEAAAAPEAKPEAKPESAAAPEATAEADTVEGEAEAEKGA